MTFAFNTSTRAARGFTPYALLLMTCFLLNALTFSVTHCISHPDQTQAEFCTLHKSVDSGDAAAVAISPQGTVPTASVYILEQADVYTVAPTANHPARAPPILFS